MNAIQMTLMVTYHLESYDAMLVKNLAIIIVKAMVGRGSKPAVHSQDRTTHIAHALIIHGRTFLQTVCLKHGINAGGACQQTKHHRIWLLCLRRCLSFWNSMGYATKRGWFNGYFTFHRKKVIAKSGFPLCDHSKKKTIYRYLKKEQGKDFQWFKIAPRLWPR